MKRYTFSLFFKVNLFLTTLIYLFFLSFNKGYTFSSFVLSFMGTLSTAATVVLVLYIVFYLLRYLNKTGLYILGSVFLLVDISLIVDFFIYRLYNFHINAMVINIITSPAAADSIQLGLAPYIIAIGIFIFFVSLELLMIRFLTNMNETKKAIRNQKLNKIIILPLFLIILIEKISFGVASVYAKNDILSSFTVIPLYQPLTFNKFAYRKLGIEEKKEVNTISGGGNNINYPLEALDYKIDAKKTNIFIFASDAVRNSIIDEAVTPNLMAFSKESFTYSNHISGGNATRFGIFSLMYGLNSTYWFKFLDATRGSILFEALESLGYQLNISSSTNTQWPEFSKTCYIDVKACIQDEFTGTPAEKDAQNSKYFKSWIEEQDLNKPIFSFMFWDAPHGRDYPNEYKKYIPDGDGKTNYLSLDEDIAKTVLFNQYKNSVHYNDALFGEMVQTLKDKGLYKDSIIIFTSDHGEEFYEYGNFGHNTAFSRAQIQSPLIIKFPHKEPKVINMLTSHMDVVPTLLSYIGVKTPTSSYSNGQDLLAKEYDRNYAFVSSWNYNAIYTNNVTMVFSNTPDKIFGNEVRYSKNYKKVDKGSEMLDSTMILKVLNENRKFLK